MSEERVYGVLKPLILLRSVIYSESRRTTFPTGGPAATPGSRKRVGGRSPGPLRWSTAMTAAPLTDLQPWQRSDAQAHAAGSCSM